MHTPHKRNLIPKSAGGTEFDEGISITTDIAGNIYLAGYFYSSSICFGSDTLSNTEPIRMFS